MPALDRLRGLRVVADAAALDRAAWQGDSVTVLRFAPDEAFALGAGHVDIDDPHAIIVDEGGFVGAWCSFADIGDHIDWSFPTEGPDLVQGAVAGMPAKLRIARDLDHILLVVAAAYAHELSDRLGWR